MNGSTPTFQSPPDGWFTFGAHVADQVALEFLGEDGAGMPLWERPDPHAQHHPCAGCGNVIPVGTEWCGGCRPEEQHTPYCFVCEINHEPPLHYDKAGFHA